MTGYGEVYYGVHEAAVNFPTTEGAGAYRVSIQKKGFSGTAVQLAIGAHSQILRQEPEKKQKFFKVCSTSLSFAFVEETALSLQEFYTEDDREWLLEYTKDSNLIYRGWIFGQNIKEHYFNEKYTFEITATDGLKDLDKIAFNDTDGLPFTYKMTCLEVLAKINVLMGLELPISTLVPVYEASQTQTDSDDVLAVIKIDQQRFLDENGNAKMCKDILEDMAVLYSANIFQRDGVLCIERWTAENEAATKRINYDKAGTFIDTTTLPAVYEISKDTSHAGVWPTVEVDIEPAIEEISVDYKYQAGSYLAPNSAFNKVSFGGGTSNVEVSLTTDYKYTKKTVATYGGWTAFGGAALSQIILNEAFTTKINLGSVFFGFSPSSWIRITKTAGECGIKSDAVYIKGGSTIGFKAGANYLLKNIGMARIGIKITSNAGVVKWFNHTNNDWQDAENRFSPAIAPVVIDNISVSSFISYKLYFKVEASKVTPFDGYMEFYVYSNPNTTDSDLQMFDVKLLTSTTDLIETERHTANNIKKYTKTIDTEVLAFSDESMGYLPSTLWKGSKIAGNFVKKGNPTFYKLVDLAVETVFLQYNRPSMIVYLDYLGVKLNIGDRVKFGVSIFPKLGNRYWKVVDNRSFCFETLLGSCTLHEVLNDSVTYDRNNQVMDKDGKTIHIDSTRIETQAQALVTGISPWTITNIL